MASTYTYNHSPTSIASLIDHTNQHQIQHSIDPTTRDSKANTPSSPAPPDQIPVVVFYPISTAETSILLKACNERRIAVTSFGAGTSFGGALAAVCGGVCVSFEEMKSVVKLNADDMDVVVQPGLGWMDLNSQIQSTGLFFPVDPAPVASIGGMIAMSCSGTNAYRYGTMKENVIGLTCVLADGRVVTTRKRPRKSAAGYDLTALIIGSEGTLGLVTEAVLRLARLPQNLHVGIAAFQDFEDGVDIVVYLQKSGHKLEAVELCDAAQMHCLNVSGLSPLHTFPEKPTLFFKIAGPSTHVLAEQIAFVRQLCEQQNAVSVEITNEKERMDVLWGARKAMGSALVKMKKRKTDLFIHSDCAVPISNLSALVSGTQELIAAASPGRQWFCSNTAHIGDGNVHSAIVCPVEDKDVAEGVVREIARLALRLEGTVTGEHGVGMELRDALEEEVGSVGVGVMRDVKKALDGRGIMNPGKVVRLVDEEERRAKL